MTGATCLIGRQVMSELVRRGNQVHPLHRSTADLGDRTAIQAEIAGARVDAAVLLGWYVKPGKYPRDENASALSLRAASAVLASLKEAGCNRVALAGTCLEVASDKGGSVSDELEKLWSSGNAPWKVW